MKLNIVFDKESEESIIYDLNEVYIKSPSGDNVEAILISDKYKLENKEFREFYILEAEEYMEKENPEYISENNRNKQIIDLIKQALIKSFTIKDFNSFNIKFNNINEISTYKPFLEELEGEIFLDVNLLSKEGISELKSIKFKSEPSINYEYNIDFVPLSEFLETVELIKIMETNISRFSLSEIESQLLLFDLIRERVYKVSDGEEPSASRDLSRVLKEEEIVCAGYANIFAAVSNHLGIPAFVKTYINKNNEKQGHATNVSYIYDSVYNQSFVLEHDLTWNSKKSEDDDEWINNYIYFGQSEANASISKSSKYYPVSTLILGLKETYDRYLIFNQNNMIKPILNKEVKIFVKKALQIYKYLNNEGRVKELELFLENLDENSIIDAKYIENLYKEIIDIHKKNIPLDIFIKILYRVRRIEHSLDPKKYPLSLEIIESIASQKYKAEQLLLKLISRFEIENLEVLKYISDDEPKIKYDIKMMELLYHLRQAEKEKQDEISLTNK